MDDFNINLGEGEWWEYDSNFKEVVFFDRIGKETPMPLLQHFRSWSMTSIQKQLGKLIFFVLIFKVLNKQFSFLGCS